MAQARRATSAPKPPAKPAVKEHTDWSGHPAEVAGVAFSWAIFLPLLFRVTHVPPWIVLVIHLGIGVCLVAAGYHRKPRPLSMRSIVYRFAGSFVFGQWIFWNAADTAKIGPGTMAGFAQIIVAAGLAAIAMVGAQHRNFKYPAGAAAIWIVATELAIFAATRSLGTGVLDWAGHLTTVTQPLNRSNFVGWIWPYGGLGAGFLASVFAILGNSFANHEAEEDARRELAMILKTGGRAREAMRLLLVEIVRDEHINVIDVKKWPNGGGQTFELDISQTNVAGTRALLPYAELLGVRMRLPDACGVEFIKGPSRHLVRMDVAMVNRMKDKIPYPVDGMVPSTIYDPRQVGVLRAGDPALVSLREDAMIVFGQRRSGKTTFLQDLIASLAQGTDTLIWVIDFNKGGVALPYLPAWLHGRADRPIIDWVATDVTEALLMAETAVQIATDRKAYYHFRKQRDNVTLLPIDKDVPQVMIILDEGAEAMGTGADQDAKEVCKVLEKLIRIAGDSAFNVVLSFLRATADHVDPAVKSACPVRAAMRVSERSDLAYAFGEWAADPSDATEQGSGHIQTDHSSSARVFKAFNQDPAGMDRIAIQAAKWRPYLDARGREIGGRIYRDRWRRATREVIELIGPSADGLMVDLDADPDRDADPNQGRPTTRTGVVAGSAQRAGAATMTAPRPAVEGRPAPGNAKDQLARNQEMVDRLAKLGRDAEVPPVDLNDPDQVRDAAEALIGRAFSDQPEPVAEEPASAPAAPTGLIAPPGMGADGPGESEEGPAGAAAAIERLLLERGPMGVTQIVKELGESGTRVSAVWVHKVLAKATYLCARQEREPYDHRNRQDHSQP